MKSSLSQFLFGALVLNAIFLPGHAVAQTPPQFGTNLITNSGAEDGQGATNDTLVPIPGWTRKGNFQVVPYGTSGGPGLTDPGPKERGKNYFVGGPDNPASSASQSIDVSALTPAFARGTAKFSLSAYLGGYSSQGDHTVLLASFRNKAGRSLKTVTLGPVTPAQRKN